MKKEDLKNMKLLVNRQVNLSVEELTTQFNCAIKSCWGACDNQEIITIEKDDLKAIINKVAFYLDLE